MINGRAWSARRLDVALAVVIVMAGEIEAVVRFRTEPLRLAIEMSGALVLGVLMVRRRRPLLAMTGLTAAACASSLIESRLPGARGSADAIVPIIAVLVLTYSLGVYANWRALVVGAVQPLALVLVVDLTQPSGNSIPSALAFFGVFVVAVPVLAGRLVRAHIHLVERLRVTRQLLDEQRAAAAEAAQALERLRLTGELHTTLVAGFTSLLADADGGDWPGAAPDPVGADPVERIQRIEATARALLGRTREVVVALATPTLSPIDEPPDARSESRAGFGEAALPWAILAAAVIGVGLLVAVPTMYRHAPLVWAYLGCLAIAAPLAFAPARPLLAVVLSWLGVAAVSLWVAPLGPVFAAIGLTFVSPFLVAALADRWRAVAGLVICAVGELAFLGPGAAGNLPIVVLSWTAGRALADRLRLVADLRATNAELDRQREAVARRAVYEERARLARELHDAVGHGLTVVALQAGGARRLWGTDPDAATATLATIARVARTGLAELRLGFVPTEAAPPQQVADLVHSARSAGLTVTVNDAGAGQRLDDAGRLAVYRVVQEALTNVLRHAPGAEVDVRYFDEPDGVGVTVTNSAPPVYPLWTDIEPRPPGRGLPGMRSRVESYGGRLDWSERLGGGFELRAWFPCPVAAP